MATTVHLEDCMEVHGKDGLEVIKANTEMLLALPWNGSFGLFKVRMLNAVQIRACGSFSTLDAVASETKTEMSLEEVIELKNMQEALFRASLVSPTYDEINEYLGTTDMVVHMRETIAECRTLLREVEDLEESKKLANEIETLEIQCAFLYPDDFTATLTAILLQKDNTDIRKVTKEMLLEWAIFAEKGDDNPADHAEGVFTEFQREDINRYAHIELAEYRETEQNVRNSSKRWVRGKRKR